MRRSSHTLVPAAVLTGLLAALLLACGTQQAAGPADPGASDLTRVPAEVPPDPAEPEPATLMQPPAIVIEAGGTTYPTALQSYCWSAPAQDGLTSGACVDMVGPADADLAEVSGVDAVEFAVPLDDVRFRASFTALDREGCDHREIVEALGDGRFRIEPTGPAAAYRVSIDGRSEQGEVPGVFRWTTSRSTATGTTPACR